MLSSITSLDILVSCIAIPKLTAALSDNGDVTPKILAIIRPTVPAT